MIRVASSARDKGKDKKEDIIVLIHSILLYFRLNSRVLTFKVFNRF